MLRYKFIQEIEANHLFINNSGKIIIDSILNAISDGNFKPETDEDFIISNLGQNLNFDNESQNPFDQWQAGSIAIIPLVGLMMKESYWWSYGVDDIANIISLAYQSDKISAVIIKANTPGGGVSSLYKIQEVLSNKLKPTFAYIDGVCQSCGYIAMSYCDKIYAINKMAVVGSIGVMSRISVVKDENSYYKTIEVYPDESADKNLTVRQAIDGKPQLLKEELSKLAQYVTGVVKENRPKIAAETLTGKDYFAYEAQELGMIDGIKTLTEVIAEIENLNKTRREFLTLI